MNIAIGDMLYSTCAGEFYGEIIGIGADANGIPTIDIRVNDANELIVMDTTDENNKPDPEWPDFHGLTSLELPEGVKAVLRHVQYRIGASVEPSDDEHEGYHFHGLTIVCLTPGDGCYRCTSFFWIYRRKSEA